MFLKIRPVQCRLRAWKNILGNLWQDPQYSGFFSFLLLNQFLALGDKIQKLEIETEDKHLKAKSSLDTVFSEFSKASLECRCLQFKV